MNKKELYVLIDKYLAGDASQEEIDLLSRYYNSFQQNSNWDIRKLGPVADMETRMFSIIKEKLKLNDSKNIVETFDEQKPGEEKPMRLYQRRNAFSFIRIATAACVIGLISLGAFFWFRNEPKNEITKAKTNIKLYKNEVLPGGDKAILKLADGSTIVLDDAKSGVLTYQGNTEVIKMNGRINYNPSSGTNEVLYNTISTPRGGKYEVKLPDGSQVWLNSFSSLRFPTAFVGRERRVEITGEAYFEIAKNKAIPFIVSVQNAEVQVLGTHFNVMAYNEEASLETTLLEGAVKFVKGNVIRNLKPGEQSQLSKTGKTNVLKDVDVNEVIAWKNGLFHFNGSDIGTVMRQLSRWYDVEVVYKGKVDELFFAQIPKNIKLSQMLEALQMTGKVHFQVNGNKIIVMD